MRLMRSAIYRFKGYSNREGRRCIQEPWICTKQLLIGHFWDYRDPIRRVPHRAPNIPNHFQTSALWLGKCANIYVSATRGIFATLIHGKLTPLISTLGPPTWIFAGKGGRAQNFGGLVERLWDPPLNSPKKFMVVSESNYPSMIRRRIWGLIIIQIFRKSGKSRNRPRYFRPWPYWYSCKLSWSPVSALG